METTGFKTLDRALKRHNLDHWGIELWTSAADTKYLLTVQVPDNVFPVRHFDGERLTAVLHGDTAKELIEALENEVSTFRLCHGHPDCGACFFGGLITQ